MKTLPLALRNLLRNRRRSLTSLLAVMIGGFALLMFGGYVRNITYGLETGFVSESGHFQVQKNDYFLYGNGNPTAYGIANYAAIIRAIRMDPRLSELANVVTPILQLGGIAGNFAAATSRTVVAIGMVVQEQNQMRQWNEHRFPIQVRPLSLTGTSSDAAVIGYGVARALDMCGVLAVANCKRATPTGANQNLASLPADIAALSVQESTKPAAADSSRQIEILAPNEHGAPNMTQLTVVKAEEQAIKELDDIFIALHLGQAQKLVFGKETPKVTAIEIQLKSTRAMSEAAPLLRKIIATLPENDQLTLLDFKILNPFYDQTLGLFNIIFGFISVLIATIVIFMLGNTMSMAVVERTVEIGTLRAIGMRRSDIRVLFITEGLLLGIFGSIFGLVLAISVAAIVNASGLHWTPPGRILEVPLTVRVWGEWLMMTIVATGLVVIAGLSSWLPAQGAARMNIVDALRHV